MAGDDAMKSETKSALLRADVCIGIAEMERGARYEDALRADGGWELHAISTISAKDVREKPYPLGSKRIIVYTPDLGGPVWSCFISPPPSPGA